MSSRHRPDTADSRAEVAALNRDRSNPPQPISPLSPAAQMRGPSTQPMANTSGPEAQPLANTSGPSTQPLTHTSGGAPISERRLREWVTVSGTAAPTAAELEEASARTFRFSVLISAVRCTLTYVILPFAAPLIGLAPGVGPAVGIPIAAVALWANALSIRRHWRVGHRWKWPISTLNAGIIVLLVVLLALDVSELL